MEFKVIKGSIDIIHKYKPIIIFEQHIDTDNYMELSSFLLNKGYQIFMINEILEGCNPDCRNFIAYNPDTSVIIKKDIKDIRSLLPVELAKLLVRIL